MSAIPSTPEDFCTAHPDWHVEVRPVRPRYHAKREDGGLSVTANSIDALDSQAAEIDARMAAA